MRESRQVSFATAQQANWPACSLHCPINAERQAGMCEHQLHSHWLDPTTNQASIYSFKGEALTTRLSELL